MRDTEAHPNKVGFPICIVLPQLGGIIAWKISSTGINFMARRHSNTRGTSPKKDEIILLLKQGETSNTIIANKVGCGVGWVGVVKNEFLRSQKA